MCLEQCDFAVVGLPGIDNAHDAAARRAADERGDYQAPRQLRSEIVERVDLHGRERVVICFDEWRAKENAYLSELAERVEVARRTGKALESIVQLKQPAREPRAAMVIAQMLKRAGVKAVLFASPSLGEPKGVDDVYVTSALRARGLTVEQQDLTSDCSQTLDHAAGLSAVRTMIAGAVDPCQLCAELERAAQRVVDRVAPRPVIDIPRSTFFHLTAESERDRHDRAPHTFANSEEPTREPIQVKLGCADSTCRQLELALARGGDVYVRSNRLVRVTGRNGIVPREYLSCVRMPRAHCTLWTSESLGREISRLVDLAVWSHHSNAYTSSFAPAHITRALLDAGAWLQLPELTGVIEVPTITGEGRVITAPGYDSASGLYLAGDDVVAGAVAIGETLTDARAAYALLAAFVSDFPFAAPHDLAAWIAYVLTIAGRYTIAGPVPAFIFSAPAKGEGKTALSQIGSIIGAGYGAADVTLGRGDEREKALTGVALKATRTVRFDNIRSGTPFADEKIEQALTTGTWCGRLLGSNALYTGDWPSVVSATGIALTVGVEMSRRVVPCMLDSRLEHPEDRTGFVRQDIVAAASDEQPELLAAALTILRAHIRAGRPQPIGNTPMGGFAAWDRLVRDAIIWTADIDPLAGRVALRQRVSEDDPDVALLRALHNFGKRQQGTGGPDPSWWCAADVAAAVAESGLDAFSELRGAVEHARERRRARSYGPPKQQAITALIAPLIGATRGGYLLRAQGNPKRGRIYRVDVIDSQDDDPEVTVG